MGPLGPDLPIIAAYTLGHANAVRQMEAAIKQPIDRPCAESAKSMELAAQHIGLQTTARDQHQWHTDRIVRERYARPATRRD